jgi:cell division protein FtsI (penicillin-binding protein 3)
MDARKHRVRRAAVVGGIFMLCLVAIGVRAGYVQIFCGEWLQNKAEGQVKKKLTVQAQRGTIYDARQQALAVSIETPSIAAYPGSIKDKPRAAALLAKTLGLKPGAVLHKLNSTKQFVWLKRQVTPKTAEAVKALKIEGVGSSQEQDRFYPNSELAAQVLGFTGVDGNGLEGLEYYYDRELKGEEQKVTIFKDKLGRGFAGDPLAGLRPAGSNLVLTLDSNVQFIAERALGEAVEAHNAQSGLAIVMNPKTGALLAIAHVPAFDPNNYGKHHSSSWRNRAITDYFEPGSTMKIFSVAAALETGTIDADTIFYCENGTYLVGDHTVHDTKSHGWLSLQQIVKYSSNIGAVKLVEKIGRRSLYNSLRQFGFGQRTQIDCPGESSGSLAHYKRWTSVDAGAIAFGQGVSVTGLQLITAVAALANDGLMMQPHIVQAVTDFNGQLVRNVEPRAVGQVVSAKTARAVRRMMRTVITEGGTGTHAELDGYDVCGKTGTAQKIGKNGRYAPNKYVSSFVGFAPAQQPALAVLVIVDEPQAVHYGGVVAGPAFRRIIKETLGYLKISPNKGIQRLQVAREVDVSG